MSVIETEHGYLLLASISGYPKSLPNEPRLSFIHLTTAQTRSTQRERNRLLEGHRRAFGPGQFKCHIPKLGS